MKYKLIDENGNEVEGITDIEALDDNKFLRDIWQNGYEDGYSEAVRRGESF